MKTIKGGSYALLLAVAVGCGGTSAQTNHDSGSAGSPTTDGQTSADASASGGDAGTSATAGSGGEPGTTGAAGSTGTTGAAGTGTAGAAGTGGSGSAGAGTAGAAGGGAGGTTSAMADGGAGTGPDGGAAGRGAAGSGPKLDGGAAGSTMTASAYPPENPDISKLCTPAIKYTDTVPTTFGGMRFDMAFPDHVAWMQEISRTVCRYLYRKPTEVKNVPLITLSIEQFPPQFGGAAYTTGTVIEVNVNSVASLGGSAANIRDALTGMLVHESTHVWQWSDGPGPVEAMADWVRYRAGFMSLSSRPSGGNWNSPYATGAFFIAWVEDKYDRDWGYKINQGMHSSGFNYGNFIQQTFGKTPDALWAEYQADISK